MPVFSRNLGAMDGQHMSPDIRQLREYIIYMQETVEFKVSNLERTVAALEKQVADLKAALEGGA